MRRRPIVLLSAAFAACAGPPVANPAGDPAAVRAAADALVAAAGEEWPVRSRRVLDLGKAAAQPLADAIVATPDGPGVQPALAVLGALGDPAVAPALIAWIGAPRAHRDEAALALGRLGASGAIEPLRTVARDRTEPIRVRTAAACALLDLGAVADAAPLLYAVLVAGTPFGTDVSEALAIPDQSRWALERLMVIDAVRRHTGADFGLDPDAPWPRLAAAAVRCRDALAAETLPR